MATLDRGTLVRYGETTTRWFLATVVAVDEGAERHLRALASTDRRCQYAVVGVEQDLDVRPVLTAVIGDGQNIPVQLERLFRPVQGASQTIPVPVAQGFEERTGRGLGGGAVASLPRCAAGRANTGKPAAEDR